MIVNAYAVLDGFAVVVRLGLAIVMVAGGLNAWRAWRTSRTAEAKTQIENRFYLLFLLAFVLLGLNLASWPLFYLLLQSYVSQWPAAMCIYGVTQIGASSQGISGVLPDIIMFLEFSKPALVFLSGSWLVLYLINRRTTTAPLTGRILLLLIGLGVMATLDASAEASYLVIPKTEDIPTGGCCTVVPSAAERIAADSVVDRRQTIVNWGHHLLTGTMILGLGVCRFVLGPSRTRRYLLLLGFGAALSLVAATFYVSEIVSIRLLGLPYHHCVYCLFRDFPESIVASLLLLTGIFSVGWAAVVGVLVRSADVATLADQFIGGLVRIGFGAYLGSTIMFALELFSRAIISQDIVVGVKKLRSSLIRGIFWLAIVVGLPFAAHFSRQERPDRCDLNGFRIQPEYRVRIVDARNAGHTFCCIGCVQQWLKRTSATGYDVYVTDEPSGREIEASKAFFVRSSVVTNPVTGNRIHAFESRSDAERHARQAHGTLLTGSQRPFLNVDVEQQSESND